MLICSEVLPLQSNSRPATAKDLEFRPTKRFNSDTSFQSHMNGTGVLIIPDADEPVSPRRVRAYGTSSPRR